LQDGRFGKIEQEHLARYCKYFQDPVSFQVLARMTKTMVAKPDFKTGFETDSNPDLTKNYDPV
jgi:hypothetical protein